MLPDESKREIVSRLKADGLTAKEIADKTGMPYGTVYWHYQRVGNAEGSAGINDDRHLCRTCCYRGMSNGCDYISITGRSRGCKVADCNVYEKGSRKKIKAEE